VWIEVTRSGGGRIPAGRASGRRDARWRGGFAEVEEDVADRGCVGDQGDDPHRGAAPGTHQLEHLIDAGERQRPGVAA